MPGRPYVLAETTWKAVRDTEYEVAILPWGATEAHNYHLPYGTDNVESERIAVEAARLAWDRDAKVVVLPVVPFGVNAQQLDIRMTLNLNPSTQARVLEDLIRSLESHAVRKLIILNGHGGNDFRQMIRELQPRTSIFLCALNWYTVVAADSFFEQAGDHAGELETSLMLHLEPDKILPLSEAGRGEARAFRIRAFREGWAWAPREWTRVTEDTGVGDPSLATAEKGRAYFEAVTSRIAELLVELAATNPADVYEES